MKCYEKQQSYHYVEAKNTINVSAALTATQVHIYILEPPPKGRVGEAGTKIGQRSMLSKVDCMKLNQKFGCFKEGDTWHNEKIR